MKGLQTFLGMISFYHPFVPSATELSRPLYESLNQPNKNRRHLRNLHSGHRKPLWLLQCYLITGNTTQQRTSQWTPRTQQSTLCQRSTSTTLGDFWLFTLKKLTLAETRYSAFDRELLPAFQAIRHFLEGRVFHVYRLHRPQAVYIHIQWKRRTITSTDAPSINHHQVHNGLSVCTRTG